MAHILECRNFSFAYGELPVLDKVSFGLERGAWLSVIGPNGSGKSTLLKSMLRLVHGTSSGELLIADQPINNYSQRDLARFMAYVPQPGGRIPPFKVLDFLRMSRYPFGRLENTSENAESVTRALALTHMEHLADRRLDQLSGGQRQRAFLAGALAQDAEILLLDEPASFLDPGHAFAMNEMLTSLHVQYGLTIVIVTHDLSQPLSTGGLVLLLRKGRREFLGPAEKLASGGILDRVFEHAFSYLIHPKTGKTIVVA